MSKLPFVITTIKWLPYPENKPMKNDVYLAAYSNGSVDGFEWLGDKFEYADYIQVFAFAERPIFTDSEEFNFATALELMKEGIHCKSELDVEYYLDNRTFWKVTKDSQYTDCISSLEITGKWRLA